MSEGDTFAEVPEVVDSQPIDMTAEGDSIYQEAVGCCGECYHLLRHHKAQEGRCSHSGEKRGAGDQCTVKLLVYAFSQRRNRKPARKPRAKKVKAEGAEVVG